MSHAYQPEESQYACLPSEILNDILSCKSMQIRDKMRCEQVCKTWRNHLGCIEPGIRRGVWSDQLVVSTMGFAGNATPDHVTAQLQESGAYGLKAGTQSCLGPCGSTPNPQPMLITLRGSFNVKQGFALSHCPYMSTRAALLFVLWTLSSYVVFTAQGQRCC